MKGFESLVHLLDSVVSNGNDNRYFGLLWCRQGSISRILLPRESWWVFLLVLHLE